MNSASIVIPSRRSLATSVESIWSAIEFGRIANMPVIISDNSGQQEKADYFFAAPSHVRYLESPHEDGVANLLHGLTHVKTTFVLVMGDDDFISLPQGQSAFALHMPAADVVAIKPRIELASPAGDIVAVNDFSIDGTDAPARIVEYTRKMAGGNSSFYSFMRTAQLRDIYQLVDAHHPSKVGNMDFAVVYAMIAEGRMLLDDRIAFRYDNSRWNDAETSRQAMVDLFSSSGLPAEALSYMTLLHYLDAFVLMLRNNSTLPPMERLRAGFTMAVLFVGRFLERAKANPDDYTICNDLIEQLSATLALDEPDPNGIFHLGGLIMDRIKPGMKKAYDDFLLAAIHGAETHAI